MALFLESGYATLNKFGEELCGDKVEVASNNDYITLVLADGMGSGVKANILATLTSKILCTMISHNIEIEACVETIIQSLPVCRVRGVAYATFSIIHVNKEGKGYLIEFDNPQAIYYSEGNTVDLDRNKMIVLDKTVYKTELSLKENDVIIVFSDGVVHAGVGTLLNFGWQRPEIKDYLKKVLDRQMSARCISTLLAGACNDLYLDKPGDDTTVATLRIRKEVHANIMVGPPVDKATDEFYVKKFLSGDTKKIVCGGTSSQIVAKYMNVPLKTSFDFPDREVPPIGYIDGIDLTTEGVLTLRKILKLSETYLSATDLTSKKFTKKDGASLLAEVLFEEATHINFFVGQSVNIAHQGLPIDTTMKLKLVESLANNLKLMGKVVSISYY